MNEAIPLSPNVRVLQQMYCDLVYFQCFSFGLKLFKLLFHVFFPSQLSFLSFGSEAFAFVVSIAASWWLRLGGKDVAKEKRQVIDDSMTDASGWIFSENE